MGRQQLWLGRSATTVGGRVFGFKSKKQRQHERRILLAADERYAREVRAAEELRNEQISSTYYDYIPSGTERHGD